MEFDKQKLLVGSGILAALILVGLGIRYFLKKRKKTQVALEVEGKRSEPDPKEEGEEELEETNKTDTNEEANFSGGDAFPLKVGSQGKEVEQLQLWLLKNHGIQTNLSGIFDHPTENALMRTLETSELTADLYKKHRISDHKTFKH